MARAFDDSIETLKALAEPTRLRLLTLLRHGDLSVKDLTSLLGQSQPRLSRHLKLLSDAGWIVRFPEGAWVYYRIAEDNQLRAVWDAVAQLVDLESDVLRDDADRLARLKALQGEQAQAFFQQHAARWDALRADLVPEAQVEATILKALGRGRVERFLDVGTGTGRMLVLLRELYASATGVDPTHAMLQVARATLAEQNIENAQVRHGDGLALGLPRDSQDLVALHQVMHFFDDPRPLLAEARRVLTPSGRLLIVDFAPHGVEALRSQHQHRRLGFDGAEVCRWLEALDLNVDKPITLNAGGDGSGLSVNLWLAHDPRVVADATHLASNVEFA
ncbi:MAG: ArsR/SmtB family transcription factor [Devosiaceae bacterium]